LPSSYKTRSGDTWDKIALRALKSENLMHLMLEANPEHHYVARFNDGVELVVPEIPAADLPASLPPWRIG
jgi:phage tail protein X